jgi:hypothetical protein
VYGFSVAGLREDSDAAGVVAPEGAAGIGAVGVGSGAGEGVNTGVHCRDRGSSDECNGGDGVERAEQKLK